MAKISIKKNYLYNISYQVFALVIPLITTPYVSRVLNPAGIGKYSYTYAMVRYFWLLSSIGIATCGVRLIGLLQEDRFKRSIEFWNLFSLKLLLTCIFGLLYIFYCYFLSTDIIVALIQGIYLLASLFDISWLYQGMEDFKSISIKNFVIKILNVAFIFLFIKNENDLWLYIFGLSFFQLLGNLSMWISLKRTIAFVSIKKWTPFKYFKSSIQLFFPTISAQLFSILDKSMIGWITFSNVENGYYEQSLKIVEMLLVLITTLGTIMIPRIARDYSVGDNEKIKKSLDKSVEFTIMLGVPLMFGLISVSNLFVPIFFGPGYEKTIIIINILSFLFIFMGINNITGQQYLTATHQENKHSLFLLIGGFVNILLNYLLIKKYLSIGAAIGTVLGEVSISLMETIYLKMSNQYNFFNQFKTVTKYFVSGIIMYISLLFFNNLNFANNLVMLLLSCFLGIIIYFCLLFLFKSKLLIDEIFKIKEFLFKLRKGKI